jgi:hypothetical protein
VYADFVVVRHHHYPVPVPVVDADILLYRILYCLEYVYWLRLVPLYDTVVKLHHPQGKQRPVLLLLLLLLLQ